MKGPANALDLLECLNSSEGGMEKKHKASKTLQDIFQLKPEKKESR